MENATQQDALESEEVVVEESTEDQPVEEMNASVNPMSAREKALEEIYNRRREEEGVEDVQEVLEDTPEAPVWHDGEKWLTKIKVNGEEGARAFV
jgi:hypothetical protein